MPVSGWKTNDGQFFDNHADAIAHEKACVGAMRISRIEANIAALIRNYAESRAVNSLTRLQIQEMLMTRTSLFRDELSDLTKAREAQRVQTESSPSGYR